MIFTSTKEQAGDSEQMKAAKFTARIVKECTIVVMAFMTFLWVTTIVFISIAVVGLTSSQ